jgi:hypothetical protein
MLFCYLCPDVIQVVGFVLVMRLCCSFTLGFTLMMVGDSGTLLRSLPT